MSIPPRKSTTMAIRLLTHVPAAAEATHRTPETACPTLPPRNTVRTSFCASRTVICASPTVSYRLGRRLRVDRLSSWSHVTPTVIRGSSLR